MFYRWIIRTSETFYTLYPVELEVNDTTPVCINLNKTITWNKETQMTGQHEPLWKPEVEPGAPEG